MSSRTLAGRATRPLAVGLGLGLAASALTLTTSSTASAVVEPVDVTIIATNDFHGRLLPARDAGGAAKLATAVDSVRADHPDAIFAAAGDLIGASTFESFIQQDKPTIDALNEAGLDVSAVGNHEFDQGYDDLVNRVMAPESEANPFGGAQWAYIGANVKMRDTGSDALDPTYVHTVGEGADAVDVGFIGAVTEHLPELVSPDGISEIVVTDIVDEVNAEADALEAEGVDVIVMLVHEGAPTTDCTKIGALSAESDFGSIVKGVDSSVDAIVSGHTHLAYDCKLGSAEAPAQLRPVVSAGQYGFNINRVSFDVDPVAGSILGVDTEIINVARTANPFTEDPEVKQIVDDAVAVSDELGAAKLGEIAGPFTRAKRADGTTENRGGESRNGQPRGRGAALGHRHRHRVHEPRRSAGRHRRPRAGRLPRHADLQAGCRGPAVRQHPGQDGPHRCPAEVGARGAVAARRCLAAVPAPRCLEGLRVDLRPRRGQGRAHHRHVARRRDGRAGRHLLGDRQLLPGLGRRQLHHLRPRRQPHRHRAVRPAGDGRLHGRVRLRRGRRGRLLAAQRRRDLPRGRAVDVRRR